MGVRGNECEAFPCLCAADELIDLPYEENETKILRFANYLRMVFQQSDDAAETELLQAATAALGAIARTVQLCAGPCLCGGVTRSRGGCLFTVRFL